MKIQVIIGSVRQGRIGPQIARWVTKVIKEYEEVQVEVLDLKRWNLPMDDEPDIPAYGTYTQNHTKEWSDKISSGDGFLFLFPQYNWGYPAALKNAIDHLYAEWQGKPAILVTYAYRGGGKAAEQFKGVLQGIHMAILKNNVEISIKDLNFTKEDSGKINDDVFRDLEQYRDKLKNAIDEAISIKSNQE